MLAYQSLESIKTPVTLDQVPTTSMENRSDAARICMS